MLLDPPSPPRWLQVGNVSRKSAELKWTVPERDGGSPITNYVVEKRDARRKGWQAVDTTIKECKYTVTPLSDGALYVFRVAAENSVGLSGYCELADSVLAKDTFSKLLIFFHIVHKHLCIFYPNIFSFCSSSYSWTSLCFGCY